MASKQKKKKTLSVIIITKNESEMITGCLESVKWADEIIIVDALSRDDTIQKAKKFTKKIFKRKWSGFASQKNFAISKATKDWILLVDADERVSGKLKNEINKLLKQKTTFNAYNIPFINYFLGKKMSHGGWQYETHIRLFKNNGAKYPQQEIHEVVEFEGELGQLSGPIYHFSHRDIASNLLKTHQYGIVEANYHYLRKSPIVTRKTLLRGIWEHFWHRYVKEKGYKDGMEGLIEAIYQAFSYVFITQSMLWELQRGKTSLELYKDLDKKLQKNKWMLT